MTTGSSERGVEGPIFHIALRTSWDRAQAVGHYTESTRDATLDDVGFLHCSFAAQVEPVAALVFGDYDGELVLLEIDPALVPAPIVVEPAVAGGAERFPHIYGPLPTAAVRAVHPLGRVDGRWRAPGNLGGS